MKRKLFILLLFIVMALCLAVGFSACDDKEGGSEANAEIISVNNATITDNDIYLLVDNTTTSVSLSSAVICSENCSWKLYASDHITEIPTKVITSLEDGANTYYLVITSTLDNTVSATYILTVYKSYAVTVNFYNGDEIIKIETAYTGYPYSANYIPDITGYTLNYWYTIDGQTYSTTTIWEDLNLYAKWQENYSLILYYGDDFSYTKEVALTISEDGIFTTVGVTSIKITEFKTVVGYYLDKDFSLESEIFFPYTPTLDLFDDAEEEGVLKVYAHTILEKYTVVSKASNIITFYDATNIYLKNDVDMTGVTVTFPEAYRGTFLGNGYTISNLTVNQSTFGNYSNYGLFRQIVSGGSLSNVTFDNLTVNVTLDYRRAIASYTVGLLAGSILSGAELSNVVVTGTLNIYYTTEVETNITYGALCGELGSGVVIENCTYTDITVTYKNSDETTSD